MSWVPPGCWTAPPGSSAGEAQTTGWPTGRAFGAVVRHQLFQQVLVLKGQGIFLALSRDGHWLAAGSYPPASCVLWDATPLPEK